MVSIIVPVYNVEKYIGKALESVIGQTYQDLEILIVDDCGNDLSMEIVERQCPLIGRQSYRQYLSLQNIQILRHNHNRGLSAARNTALEVAKGEWVYFFDSDDILAPDCIETLVKLAEANPDAEMIVGQYDEFTEGEEYHPARWKQLGGVYGDDVIGAYMDGKIPTTAWNKLVRRDFLIKNSLWFEEGLVHEDALWSFQVFCLAHKVVVADAITYHYLQRPGSLDKQKNWALHATHYNRVYCLQAKFVFENGLQGDKRLFHFIEKRRYQLLTDAAMKDRRLGYELYQETRRYAYWWQWHRLLPCLLGYIVYIRVRCWWLRFKA